MPNPYSYREVRELPADSATLRHMVMTLLEDNQNLHEGYKRLERDNASLSDSNADLKHQTASLSSTNKELEDLIKDLKRQLAILKKKSYGKSSEKLQRQLDNLQLQIEDNEITLGIQRKQKETTPASDGKKKRKSGRKPLPKNLPTEEVTLEAAAKCPTCSGDKFRVLGEDVSEVLEYVPASFKIIKYIRPRCICNNCQEILQAEAASKVIDKGKAGAGLLAHILVQKYANHLPLYRQSQMYAREGVDLSVSTLCDWMSSCSKLLKLLVGEVQKHVFSSSEIHGDDTLVKVLDPGGGKAKTGRLWGYVTDGRPHGSSDPPAVCYFYSPNRKAEHPLSHLENYKGVLHADAYSGYNKLYKDSEGKDTEITESACWAHTRRKFYEVTLLGNNAVVAGEVVDQIAKLYAIENSVRGLSPEQRLLARKEKSQQLVDELFDGFRKVKSKLPQKGGTVKAINYALNNEEALRHFLTDGRVEIDNNAAERALRGIAVGRKNWLFAGADGGGETAACIYTLIETAKLNGVNPWEYLKLVLSVIQDHNSQKLHELLPWNISKKVN